MPHKTIKQKGHSAQLLEKSKPTPARELKTRGVKTPTTAAPKRRAKVRSGGTGRTTRFTLTQRTGRTKNPLRPDSIKTQGKQAQVSKVLKTPTVQRALKTAEMGDTSRSAKRNSSLKTLKKINKVAKRIRTPLGIAFTLGLDEIIKIKSAKKLPRVI